MVSKVFLLKLKDLCYALFCTLFLISVVKNVNAENNGYKKSYYGSILAGQIANYNNDPKNSASFFNFANNINPRNIEVYNLALMSLIINGEIETAVSKVINYESKYGKPGNKSVISDYIIFIDKVKNNKRLEASKYLNNNNFLITEKMKPILKAWLADSFDNSIKALNEYEYKSEGLALSNIYFHHLGLIESYYKKINLSKKTFEKHLEVFELKKLRSLYFYKNYFVKENDNNKNIITSNFLNSYPDHSFSVYLNKNNNNLKSYQEASQGISEAIYNLAETLYGQNMYETSLALAQTALFLNPKNHIIKYLISLNFSSLGKKVTAISYLDKIPVDSYVYWNAALKTSELYMELEDYVSARSYLNKLEQFNNQRTDLYYRLGEIYHIQQKYSAAVKYYSKAISRAKTVSTKDWYLYYSRGMSYERSNEWEKAEKDFLKSLELSPEQPLTLNYLGYSWIDLGKNIDKAHTLISKAVNLRPNDGYFVDSLGWAFYRMGEYEKAVLELERAVGLVPNDPIINDHLGDAMWRAGYKNEAIFQWNRALLYKPENDLRQKIKFKLKKGL